MHLLAAEQTNQILYQMKVVRCAVASPGNPEIPSNLDLCSTQPATSLMNSPKMGKSTRYKKRLWVMGRSL